MSAVAFDTHAAVKTLREAGADEAKAEAIVKTASAAVGAGHDQLATKADLADIKAELADTRADVVELQASTKADFAELRASTKADLATLEARLTNTLATKAELRAAIDPLASKSDLAAAIAGVRAELGILRWAVGLSAAFLFAIVVRVFGLI